MGHNRYAPLYFPLITLFHSFFDTLLHATAIIYPPILCAVTNYHSFSVQPFHTYL